MLHFRYAPDAAKPWRGNSPLEVAALAGRLSSETVNALADESSGPVGSLLGIPKDGDDDTVTALKSDIKNARGRVALLESGDWDNTGGGNVDLETKRFGANPPAALVELLEVSSREVWSACGFNSALFMGSQAAAVRESWRLALFGVLSPLGRLVETELRAKLGDVTLDWSELRASDLSGRARGVPVDGWRRYAGCRRRSDCRADGRRLAPRVRLWWWYKPLNSSINRLPQVKNPITAGVLPLNPITTALPLFCERRPSCQRGQMVTEATNRALFVLGALMALDNVLRRKGVPKHGGYAKDSRRRELSPRTVPSDAHNRPRTPVKRVFG